ncbi:hypothetical protein SB659_18170 [Arthrobacter sp. SIMBA_036]|uniref:hypothetical protein n=1 Tax=Arthrobacter sp. SIMBA_036 TaxID=3085778 RepID=UPI00397DA241
MAGISFEQARIIIRTRNETDWFTDGVHGTYTVADYGYEDGERFYILDGAREYLVDGNIDFLLIGSGHNVVNKITGDVQCWSYVDHPDEITNMTPVPGHEPPEAASACQRQTGGPRHCGRPPYLFALTSKAETAGGWRSVLRPGTGA